MDHGRSGSLAKFLALNSQPRKLLATDLPHRLKDLRNALHGIAAAETRLPTVGTRRVESIWVNYNDHFIYMYITFSMLNFYICYDIWLYSY